jgi:hypothetical protein
MTEICVSLNTLTGKKSPFDTKRDSFFNET